MKLYRKIRKLINFTYDFDRYLIKSFVKKLGEKQIIALVFSFNMFFRDVNGAG